MELPGVVVHSLYKPPPEPFLLPPLGQRIKPHIVIGDFNSHSTLWGHTTTDSDGEAVEQCAYSNRLSLIHNAKLPKSFNSAIWKKGYNPDLIFVYQGGVGQTTYLVSRKSHRAYMKHTRNSTQATLLPKEPWRLETI